MASDHFSPKKPDNHLDHGNKLVAVIKKKQHCAWILSKMWWDCKQCTVGRYCLIPSKLFVMLLWWEPPNHTNDERLLFLMIKWSMGRLIRAWKIQSIFTDFFWTKLKKWPFVKFFSEVKLKFQKIGWIKFWYYWKCLILSWTNSIEIESDP